MNINYDIFLENIHYCDYIDYNIDSKYYPIIPPNLPKISVEDKLKYNFPKDILIYRNEKIVNHGIVLDYYDLTELFELDVSIMLDAILYMCRVFDANVNSVELLD